MRILFLGSNPSIKSGSLKPFWYDTKSTAVLAQWIDLTGVSVENVSFLNVSNIPTPNNRPLKVSEIKANLKRLAGEIEYDYYPEKIVALGRAAEKALTLLHIPHFAMPHPSGLNRKLNDKAYVAEKINGLKNYLKPI